MRRLLLGLAALTPIVLAPGDPIPDIDVVVEQIPGPKLATHTGADGSFSFTLGPGNYVLHISSRPKGVSGTKPASRASVANNGRLVPLPPAVTGQGGWPYALRIADAGLTLGQMRLAGPTANQRAVTPTGNELEVHFTIPAQPRGAAEKVSVRGGVEAKN